uniref:Bro-N domain-containing protein n=1 Tax=Drosophila-associated filamentous virus TaxID=2743186 RepID=A0A6M9U004_9VIRU|nr:putative protein 33 [Drosophila-associated filamentous virus]
MTLCEHYFSFKDSVYLFSTFYVDKDFVVDNNNDDALWFRAVDIAKILTYHNSTDESIYMDKSINGDYKMHWNILQNVFNHGNEKIKKPFLDQTVFINKSGLIQMFDKAPNDSLTNKLKGQILQSIEPYKKKSTLKRNFISLFDFFKKYKSF